MKAIRYIIASLSVSAIALTSCVNLDIKPQNIVGDDDAFASADGIEAYMAKIYSELPIEGFRYSVRNSNLFNDQSQYSVASAVWGESICRDRGGADSEGDYWDDAYKTIRRANYFIETIPQYASYHNETDIQHWIGEATFLRAYVYYALAKRYGGVPYVDKVMNYPELSIPETQLSRDSEEDTWRKIAADFDYAYENMNETSSKRGRANRYYAAGMKSRAMLFAGCIAKYNEVSHYDDKTGKRVCGMDKALAKDFFKQAYDAARLCDGHYSLYKKSWSTTDKEAQITNFVNLFLDTDNPEIIMAQEYFYPSFTHSWDKFMLNRQWVMDGIGSSTAPTLDFVEMFDGIPKNANGKWQSYDDNGNYILYDNTFAPFENAEPRLRATILVPGETFKGKVFDLRRGIYVGAYDTGGGIDPLLPEGSMDAYPTDRIVQSGDPNQVAYTLPDGTSIYPAGEGGIYSSNRESAFSGFSLRKFLDPNMPDETIKENVCDQQWVELRYGEVMLNRAEAAYELFLEGQSGETDYASDAMSMINQIRERGGAEQLVSTDELTLEVIRTERRKELGFENKVYWDLRRWRTLDDEQDGRIYRILMPFLDQNSGKYFFDARYDERNTRYTFDTRRYYYPIPTAEISKNPNMVQNPGY